MAAIATIVLTLPYCTKDDIYNPVQGESPLSTQVRIQAVYDATDVAFRFVWKSQKKIYPTGFDNTGLNYPGHFHDILMHNGTKFDRLTSAGRLQEDRVSMIIDKFEGGVQGFASAGCAISCHSGMDSHHLLTEDVLDHWHWRGGRSGPMGYAEDAAIDDVERIRDNATVASKFLRSGGDRQRENQAALTGTSHAVLIDGLPRFVFNKGKSMAGNYVIPSYFIVNESNNPVTNPYQQSPQVKDLSDNLSLLVAYQDESFDPIDKMNALDLGYLAWIATGNLDHMPTHLQDSGTADFTFWNNYWANATGITTAAAALAKLNDVHQEWNNDKRLMVTRSIGFIYASDQHDIRSERAYNADRNEWTVVLKRKLSTGSNRDADLSGLPGGEKFALSFAMHDSGSGSETHDISLPLLVSTASGADIQVVSVGNINQVDWTTVPMHDTYWVKQSLMDKYTWDWLLSAEHAGASAVEITNCNTCHSGEKSLLTNTVLE